jgi:hypothetical protein
MLNITNGCHGATDVPKIKGRGIACRHATKRQLACLAASIAEGDTSFVPSMQQLATLFGVSTAYINVAKKLSPAARKAVIEGTISVDFPVLLSQLATIVALPAPRLVSDVELEAIVRQAGITRVLDAAVSVEAHAAA